MQAVHKKIAALLVFCSMAGLLAAKKKADTKDVATQQKRALHALDRLTFGPRPGRRTSRHHDGSGKVDRAPTPS